MCPLKVGSPAGAQTLPPDSGSSWGRCFADRGPLQHLHPDHHRGRLRCPLGSGETSGHPQSRPERFLLCRSSALRSVQRGCSRVSTSVVACPFHEDTCISRGRGCFGFLNSSRISQPYSRQTRSFACFSITQEIQQYRKSWVKRKIGNKWSRNSLLLRNTHFVPSLSIFCWVCFGEQHRKQ